MTTKNRIMPIIACLFQVSTLNTSWGKTTKERQNSVGDVVSELTIIREQLKHPNIVRYYRTFIIGKHFDCALLAVTRKYDIWQERSFKAIHFINVKNRVAYTSKTTKIGI